MVVKELNLTGRRDLRQVGSAAGTPRRRSSATPHKEGPRTGTEMAEISVPILCNNAESGGALCPAVLKRVTTELGREGPCCWNNWWKKLPSRRSMTGTHTIAGCSAGSPAET